MSVYKEYLAGVWGSRLNRAGYQSSLEDRQVRLARFGMIISAALVILMGISEIIFLCLFLWYLFR